jgi:hypothetical protein
MHLNKSASEMALIWSGLYILASTFAARAQNWIVLARNFIPVVGVYLLGWSQHVTTFAYWFEGVCMVAVIVVTLCVRVPEEKFKSAPWRQIPQLLIVTILCGAFAFFLVAIPYWMAYSALELDFAVEQIRRNHYLALSFLCTLVAIVVKTFQRGGYMRLSNDDLKSRWQLDLHNLGARAFAMVVIAGWNFGFVLVPLIALLLTGIEVWPVMRQDLEGQPRR